MQTISQVTGALLSGIDASRKLETPTSKGELTQSVSQNGVVQPSRSSQKIEPEQHRSEREKEQFTLALSQACTALKQYGKTPAELRDLRDMFLTVLADIPTPLIIKALFIHLNTSDEIPTPRQLREIVYPPKPVWKPDWPAYIALKKRIYEGYYPLSDERKFLSDCENYAFTKQDREMESYENAKKEISGHQLMLERVDGYLE